MKRRTVAHLALLAAVLVLGLFAAPEIVSIVRNGLTPEQMPQTLFVLFAALGGLVAFFNPCSLAAYPAMVSMVFNAQEKNEPPVLLAATAAAGLTSFYVLAIGALIAFGTAVSSLLIDSRIFAGIALLFLAAALWFDIPINPHIRSSRFLPSGGVRGFFTIGFFYGLAGAFCTTPVLLTLFLLPLAAKTQITLLAFGLFVAVSAAAMFAATHLAIHARQSLPNTQQISRLSRYASAIVLALAAVYLLAPYLPLTK